MTRSSRTPLYATTTLYASKCMYVYVLLNVGYYYYCRVVRRSRRARMACTYIGDAQYLHKDHRKKERYTDGRPAVIVVPATHAGTTHERLFNCLLYEYVLNLR